MTTTRDFKAVHVMSGARNRRRKPREHRSIDGAESDRADH